MSLHKLTAGSGYDYLTRQVAAMDATEKGHTTLASYYSEKGEAPGTWIGAGLGGIDGLDAGDIVTAEQMKALFAYGFHPLAEDRVAQLSDGSSAVDIAAAQRLGTPYKVYKGDAPPFLIEVAQRIEEFNVAAGRAREDEVALQDRARIRSEVAREFFIREHGRQPTDARELAATVAKNSRPKTTAVAGYDLTFSPVKSVSALWAVADPALAARIERAHKSAVRDALTFIEDHALFTRTGTNGVRQVEVRGLVATSFTHRDSRAGDPDLHTHVAIANKVQTHDGRWLAIDGRLLYKATVSASETYNTALERHLATDLGVAFAPRQSTDPRKRPIREIVGVDPALNDRWSSRRHSIEARRGELTVAFQAAHGRPPTPVESIQLAQQATLETREAKHEPRSLAEQRESWRRQAKEVLGGGAAVEAMVAQSLAPPPGGGPNVIDAKWVASTGVRVIDQVQQRRSTWQIWHVVAEAQRQVRRADIRADQVDDVVRLVIDAALDASVLVASDRDTIADPQLMRRRDAVSVYSVAGSDTFTSRTVLDAEQRVVAAAGRIDGRRVASEDVELALLESAANGVELNAGQAALVRRMATSGARVQLGIAAAGTGKTTAMGVLTRAWEDAGGTVVGLAPSASAAAQLGDRTGATTDTLAKYVHDLESNKPGSPASPGGDRLPDRIGAETLVLVDEAGMADTLSLDTAISDVLQRGASVRLIGDHRQLAAIGAGGVLRDIDTQHGSLRLAELMRFADPAEGAASLALAEGLPESLGFYLDNDRIHVGDQATLNEEVFIAWQRDRRDDLDSIMLAPTRDLVSELNARARMARLENDPPAGGPEVRLADGNLVSAGDIILTRQNDRRLRLSPTDWVKNGDRWVVTTVAAGALGVEHVETGLHVSLPAEYVSSDVELGYAATVHAAQGVSVDTVRGLATGEESRQQLYTLMSRARHENHLYLVTATDGDPHSLIRPETVHPRTEVDMLESMLARDGSSKSATTMAAQAADPATRLGQAATRYADALYVGAEQLIGAERVRQLETTASDLVPGIEDEPAWPVLRAHLMLRQAQGQDAAEDLRSTVTERELDGVEDGAAVLDWRLDPTGLRGAPAGPLPWLPAIPETVAVDETWGPYLAARSAQVTSLASAVRTTVQGEELPGWARQGGARPSPELLSSVAIWRAAHAVTDDDRRPTGPQQLQKAAAAYQRQLEERLGAGRSPALATWGPLIDELHPRRDAFTALLAERLAAISRSGIDAEKLFHRAAGEAPLPDEHVAAALWWRIARHLSPAVAAEHDQNDARIHAPWSDLLIDALGPEPAAAVMGSRHWPTLVATVDSALERGSQISDLTDIAGRITVDDVDLTQAIIWRLSLITDPDPDVDFDDPIPDPEDLPPEDLQDAVPVGAQRTPPPPAAAGEAYELDDLTQAAQQRRWLDPLEPSETDIARMLERNYDVYHSPVSAERIHHVNELAAEYFEAALPDSWAQPHLRQRLGQDITGDVRFRPGYAPPGWRNLIDHLHGLGVTDTEMTAAGLVKPASHGGLIDRFRDRAVLPVIHRGQILGFVGRRNPDADDKVGPKYLNTPDTIVFHKGAQLFGIADDDMLHGARPVRTEGPFDALAVTLASGGVFVGVAPLGTSLTDEQTTQLVGIGVDPIVATDGDLAGTVAAERDHWILTAHDLHPTYARLGYGDDPASILQNSGAIELVRHFHETVPLSSALIEERVANLPEVEDRIEATAAVIAAQPPETWQDSIEHTAETIGASGAAMTEAVATAAHRFNADRRRFAADHLARASDVRRRLETAQSARPADRWASLARGLDPRLTGQRDWPATATMLQDLHENGLDVNEVARDAVATAPLGDSPAQDLCYRLVGYLDAAPTHATDANVGRPEAERRGRGLNIGHRPSGPSR